MQGLLRARQSQVPPCVPIQFPREPKYLLFSSDSSLLLWNFPPHCFILLFGYLCFKSSKWLFLKPQLVLALGVPDNHQHDEQVVRIISIYSIRNFQLSYAFVIIGTRCLSTKFCACWQILEVVLLSLIQQKTAKYGFHSQANHKTHNKKEQNCQTLLRGIPTW